MSVGRGFRLLDVLGCSVPWDKKPHLPSGPSFDYVGRRATRAPSHFAQDERKGRVRGR